MDKGFGNYESGGGGYSGSNYNAPGGFMNTSPSREYGASPAKKEPSSSSFQSITPLTMKMIRSCQQNVADDSLFIDGKQMSKVVVYGRILDVNEKHTNTEYLVEDGTDVLKVIQYSPNPEENQTLEVHGQGSLVYINGAIRSVENERTLLAHHIRNVTDHNELTCHFLSVIFTHYQNTKGLLNDGSKLMNNNNSGFGGGGMFGVPASSSGGFVMDTPVLSGNVYGAASTEKQEIKLIHDTFASDMVSDSGLSITEVAGMLRMNPAKVRSVCKNLMDEGFLYSTIDDDHFKSTGAL
jgi:replication factor A2